MGGGMFFEFCIWLGKFGGVVGNFFLKTLANCKNFPKKGFDLQNPLAEEPRCQILVYLDGFFMN